MKVAIQGVKASFHDVATKKYFKEDVSIVECSSFPRLFQVLSHKEADLAVMAIENALAGSILPNYALLEKYGFKILGEVYLRIEMCLLALPGEKIDDIQVVQTHPMALHQCEEFLLTMKNAKLFEHADTAESAKDIKEKNLIHHAAIASRLAAETYGLNILKAGIETNKANFTRFLILCRNEDYKRPAHANKATICFETEHKPGSLARVLTIFQDHAVNMTKIQSLSIVGRPYQYAFHVDLEWDNDEQYEKAMSEVTNKTINLIHFGEYEAATRPQL